MKKIATNEKRDRVGSRWNSEKRYGYFFKAIALPAP
jgi:hypothetical protein